MRCLITGIAGQDGSYIAEHLLRLGYTVFGLARSDVRKYDNLRNIEHRIELIYGDVRDQLSISNAIHKADPDEIYNLAGQVFVPLSWDDPLGTFDVNTLGLQRILKILDMRSMKHVRVYQASTSEMFGNSSDAILNENTKFVPTSPYGVSKLAAHELCRVYRNKGYFVVSGILGNHESPRRGQEMVTRKVTKKVAEWVVRGFSEDRKLSIGNLTSVRDWGFAGDYVKAMHKMLQQSEPEDYVVGTGVTHSIEQLIATAAFAADLSSTVVFKNIEIDERFARVGEIKKLKIDASKAKEKLGWVPETDFAELIRMMVVEDIKNLEKQLVT